MLSSQNRFDSKFSHRISYLNMIRVKYSWQVVGGFGRRLYLVPANHQSDDELFINANSSCDSCFQYLAIQWPSRFVWKCPRLTRLRRLSIECRWKCIVRNPYDISRCTLYNAYYRRLLYMQETHTLWTFKSFCYQQGKEILPLAGCMNRNSAYAGEAWRWRRTGLYGRKE